MQIMQCLLVPSMQALAVTVFYVHFVVFGLVKDGDGRGGV